MEMGFLKNVDQLFVTKQISSHWPQGFEYTYSKFNQNEWIHQHFKNNNNVLLKWMGF